MAYTFACSQPITGYPARPHKPATAFETEVFGTDPATKEVLATDVFSCNGEQPGWGVNCTGANVGSWHPITSTFTIDGDVCTEPRVDPLLVVTYASVTAGKATQYIAGPFDLGRPRGCPKSSRNGKTRTRPTPPSRPRTRVAPISCDRLDPTPTSTAGLRRSKLLRGGPPVALQTPASSS